jgi:hypothetical protein
MQMTTPVSTENSDALFGAPSPVPLVRIFTCGDLHLEVLQSPAQSLDAACYAVPPSLQFPCRGTAPALALLKLLLSRPQRYGARDWLCEHLHPGEEEAVSPARLHDIASSLRSLLCPPITDRESRDRLRRHLLTYIPSATESGPGYRLAPYPLIWLDSDALLWSVEQACRLERFGEDAQVFWERAYALSRRGEYLVEEPYSDWAQMRRTQVQAV